MDGVLNKWNFNLPSYDTLYEKGYFLNRPPQMNVVAAIQALVSEGWDVYILSAVLMDSEFALFEKHEWLDKYLPIECKRRIFTICGEDKISFVPAFDPEKDLLIDDFGENCRTWQGTYIKVSVNEDDAEYERLHHDYVIHPDMTAESILRYIKDVAV